MPKKCLRDNMWAVQGSDYCRSHGGSLPRLTAEASVRIAEARRRLAEMQAHAPIHVKKI